MVVIRTKSACAANGETPTPAVTAAKRMATNGDTFFKPLPCVTSIIDDADRNAFVTLVQGALPPESCHDWFGTLSKLVEGQRPSVKGKLLNRESVWYTSQGCSCKYKYGGKLWPPTEMPDVLSVIFDTVAKTATRIAPVGSAHGVLSCVVNAYDPGDACGWHADKETPFGDACDIPVWSLSLGATRTFQLRDNGTVQTVASLNLKCGDILLMLGATQQWYDHRVTADANAAGKRVNITWRWITHHHHRCVHAAEGGK